MANAPALQVEVRGADLSRLGVVDDFTSFDAVQTFNAVGRWQLDVPGSCGQLANLIVAGSGILLIRQDTGAVVFSGLMDEVEESFGAEHGGWSIRGRDDNGLLADRLAIPSIDGNFGGTTYVGNVIADAPAAYYRFGEIVGPSAFDSSGHVNTGTYVGTVTFGQSSPILDGDHAISLSGSSGYVSIPDQSHLAVSAALSVEAWVNITSWVSSGTIVNRRPASNAAGYSLECASSGFFTFYVAVSGWKSISNSSAVSLGVWHHLVATYDGANVNLYIDGVVAATPVPLTGALDTPTSPLLQIGRNIFNGTLFAGAIDDVALYPTALTAARVAAHYASRTAGYDVRTGTVEAVMRGFADGNAGATALAARRITGFALGTYGGLGATVTEQARFDNLFDLLRLLAVKGATGAIPLGFRLQQTIGSPNQLVFSVYQPRDLTARVVYSPSLQNIVSYTRTAPKGPKANVVYLGGQGVLTGRPIIVASDSASIGSWGRREVFRDRRDTADTALLTTSAAQELLAQAGSESIDFEPMAVEGLLYGQDYALGDQVSFVSTRGVVLQQVVYEVEIAISADGGTRYRPRVGPPAALDPESTSQYMQTIEQRLANLEAT